MNRQKELAKFFSGVEAFHAVLHGYLWLSGTTLIVLGITATPMVSLMGAIVNAIISVGLGVYAWGSDRRRST
ncbi:MAG TPA: hypothetical protein VG897_15760 [Terriglobales bacterium]|nr:hypothetical protein [Terriglobales bacterium]